MPSSLDLRLLDVCTEKERPIVALLVEGNSQGETARKVGVTKRTVERTIARVRARSEDIILDAPTSSAIPSASRPYEDLVRDRMENFQRRQAHEDALSSLTIRVPISGPYGILVFGDPHVDDDGTDWPSLRRHTDLVKATKGLYAVNIGDTTNNWVGRLARLYAHQSTTDSDALVLAEGWIRELAGKWLFQISGNHNDWSGAGDPVARFAKEAGSTYIKYGTRLKILQGDDSIVMNARHKFAGNSIYNPAHAVGRHVLFGNSADITMAGHLHTSGYMVIKAPDGLICHAAQIASYKKYDTFAKEMGFRDNAISPAQMFVVDHRFGYASPGKVTPFFCVEQGADYLGFARRQWESGKTKR